MFVVVIGQSLGLSFVGTVVVVVWVTLGTTYFLLKVVESLLIYDIA